MGAPAASTSHLHQQFEFDGGVQRQLRGAKRHPGMAPGFAKNLHQQIGRAIDHSRLLYESRGRRNMTDNPYDPLHTVQRAEFLLHHCEGIQERQSSRFRSPFNRYVLPKLTCDRHLPVTKRQDPAQKQQVPGKHRRHITGDRFRRRGKHETEAAESFIN